MFDLWRCSCKLIHCLTNSLKKTWWFIVLSTVSVWACVGCVSLVFINRRPARMRCCRCCRCCRCVGSRLLQLSLCLSPSSWLTWGWRCVLCWSLCISSSWRNLARCSALCLFYRSRCLKHRRSQKRGNEALLGLCCILLQNGTMILIWLYWLTSCSKCPSGHRTRIMKHINMIFYQLNHIKQNISPKIAAGKSFILLI